MAKISTDLAGSLGANQPLHPRENRFVTSALASVAASSVVASDGTSSFFLNLTGTWVGTVQVEGSNDGSNYHVIPMRPWNAASLVWVVSSTATGQFVGHNPGFAFLRLRCTAFTSGSIAFTLSSSLASLDQLIQGAVTTSTGTATGAAAAAVTLTVAAAGAGLRHYFTNILIQRHTSALLTAGATPLIVTTTNLPGSRAYSFPADAAAQGVVATIQESFPRPLASSAQNTATTIVCPATTGVIWRVTADYYIAP